MKWLAMLLLPPFFLLSAASAQKITGSPEVGVEEHLGNFVPLDVPFLNEQGDTVTLGDLIQKPTLLALVYYTCPAMCPRLLSGIVDATDKLDLQPGKDYEILTISFDERDTPQLSRKKKNNYLKAFSRPFPPEAWHWLTGDTASIRAITEAVGFHYRRNGQNFAHPALITVLSPRGKVVRYLYGVTFLPFDLKMALAEAAEGRTGPTITKVLLYCFSYDPQGRHYAFNLLKVGGTVVLFLAFLFLLFLLMGNRIGKKQTR